MNLSIVSPKITPYARHTVKSGEPKLTAFVFICMRLFFE